MNDWISDEELRRLTGDAMLLYSDFEEIYKGHLVEAVMRNLPPEMDRSRVEQIVAQVAPEAL
jgi:hypothetical protein